MDLHLVRQTIRKYFTFNQNMMRRELMVRPSVRVRLDNYQVVRLPWLSLTPILAKYLMSDIPFDLPTLTQCLPMVSQPLFAKKFFLFKNILLNALLSFRSEEAERTQIFMTFLCFMNKFWWLEWMRESSGLTRAMPDEVRRAPPYGAGQQSEVCPGLSRENTSHWNIPSPPLQ